VGRRRAVSYRETLYDGIDEVPAADWDALGGGPTDPFMDRRLVRAMERSMGPGGAWSATFRYLVVRDGGGEPVATACLYYYPLDLRLLMTGGGGWLERLRRRNPERGYFKIVFCGLPLSAGQSCLRIAEGADVAAVVAILDRTLERLAVERGARLLVVRELDAAGRDRLAPLLERGYQLAGAPPMNVAPGGFASYDDWLAALPSKRRYPVRKSRQRYEAAGFAGERLDAAAGAARYSDAVHRLYEQVAAGWVRLEHLPAEFFRELARQLPAETVFDYVYAGGDPARVAAVAISLATAEQFHQLYVGFDGERNRDADLYFNLFYQVVDGAYRAGLADVRLGQSGDTFKHQKLGASQFPLYFFVRSLRPLGQALLPRILRRFYPLGRGRSAGGGY